MSDDWKRDLAKKIAEEVWMIETADEELFIKFIEDVIKKFAEERFVRVYFKVTE